MDSLFKQLAEQALENSLFETIDPTITVGEGENKVTIPLVFAEKFAELVVRECANICHKRKLTPSTFTGDELLEHFGVE